PTSPTRRASDLPQVCHVPRDLSLGHERLDLEDAAVEAVGRGDAAAPRAEVAHDVALVSPRRADGDPAHGLEHRGARLRECFLDAVRRSRAEGHLGGVDRVVLPVEALDLDVDDLEAVQPARGHGLARAALDSGDEVARDRPAYHRVLERDALAASARAQPQLGDRELAVAAGLLLE